MRHLSEHIESLLSGHISADELLEVNIRPPFSLPAGKIRLASQMVGLIPKHTTYVEPFAGSAAVFFAKPASEIEVLNDIDPAIAEALSALSKMSDEQLEAFMRRSWVGSQERYSRLFNTDFSDAMDRLYRFLYLTRLSFGAMRRRTGFRREDEGVDHRFFFERRLPEAVSRIRGAKVMNDDYESVCKKYDSPDTFFFFDPPYKGYTGLQGIEGGQKERGFDEERFYNMLKSLKGKWLLNYGAQGSLMDMLRKDYKVSKVSAKRYIGHVNKNTENRVTSLTHYICRNY